MENNIYGISFKELKAKFSGMLFFAFFFFFFLAWIPWVPNAELFLPFGFQNSNFLSRMNNRVIIPIM